MALSGNQLDLYIRQYTDMIEQELQQNGSRLRDAVTIEKGMGERLYFNKIGKAQSYQRTARFEQVQLGEQTNERRFVSPITIESVHAIDELDAVRYLRSPQPELANAMAMELGREIDLEVIRALGGTAGRELAGAVSNASFDSNFSIAVNTNTFAGTTMSSDTGLHEGKLINARRRLEAAYGVNPGEELYVVAPAIQLAGLQSRTFASSAAGWFQELPDINAPGLVKALDGFMGFRFISHEGLGVDGSSDQYAYVFPKNAVKLGIWKDINFRVDQRADLGGAPVQLMANMTIGAVRMFEEKVVRILCDPTPLYA